MHVPLRARRGERNEVAERKLEQAVSENSEGGGITSHTSFFGIFLTLQILLSLVLVPLKAEHSL